MSNPFVSPYTDPDGTTRRPLAERVPECVPTYLKPFDWEMQPRGLRRVDDDVEDALWRVAVEDWILKFDDITYRGTAGRVLVQYASDSDGYCETIGSGVFLEALNQAAHEVADAKGMER